MNGLAKERMTGHVRVEDLDGIAAVTLSHPGKLNAMSRAMWRELLRVFTALHAGNARCVIVRGEGGAFCAGGDISEYPAFRFEEASLRAFHEDDVWGGLQAVLDCDVPVIAQIEGACMGAGMEIASACDIRIAAANTDFGQDENAHGRFPGGGATVRFVREAGWGNAMRYMLTGDHWTAEESFRIGVTQVMAPTPAAALEAGVAMARKVAAVAPLSTRATLTSARHVTTPIEADALAKTGPTYVALYKTEDFIEGRRAEAEGRPPKFRGK